MKTLQDYILEAIENDEINEGKIWDAVKKWWNNLFDTDKKKYNRYTAKIDNKMNVEYKQSLLHEFTINKLSITKVNPSSLKTIVFPQGETPNKETNTGFWDFEDEKIPSDNSFEIYGFVYKSDTANDTAALIKVKQHNDTENYTEILKIQIIDEFSNVLKLSDLIDFIFDNSKDILLNSDYLMIYKDTNKSLYEKLVNDCDFVKETLNNKNLAKRTKQ